MLAHQGCHRSPRSPKHPQCLRGDGVPPPQSGPQEAAQPNPNPGASPGKWEHFSSLSGPLFGRMSPGGAVGPGSSSRLWPRCWGQAFSQPGPQLKIPGRREMAAPHRLRPPLLLWDGVIICAWSSLVTAKNSCLWLGTGTWAGGRQDPGCAEGPGAAGAPLLGCPLQEGGHAPLGCCRSTHPRAASPPSRLIFAASLCSPGIAHLQHPSRRCRGFSRAWSKSPKG